MELKKVMLSIGIGVLSALFIGFLIEAIYESPDYMDFCTNQFDVPQPQIQNQQVCNFSYNTELRKQCTKDQGMIREEYDTKGCVTNETCDFCDKEFQETNEKYNRNLFFITAPIGLLLIILGLYLSINIDAIAGGFLLGGVLTMTQVTMRIFGDLSKWPRVILLGVELAIVIWIGLKKVYGKKEKK